MILRTSLTLATLLPGSLLIAQGAPAAAPRMADPPAVTSPSATLRPSLEILKSALGATNVDRWKGSNAIKGEASANMRSIANDVTSTLPSLLSAADAAPGSPAKVLPAYRNADALYDVLLRVVVSAHLYAPADQSSGLDQALQSLEDSRRSLGDQLQKVALNQDTQVVKLQAALRAVPPPQAAPPAPEPVKCPAPTTRKRTTAKAAAKPAAKPSPATSH
ncbi:MAG TPA: hypothetical protein VN612_13850 [Acidobacteriaceae bacterium]|nr:hypothetical protein [Acidobacteriaceae bacterium]